MTYSKITKEQIRELSLKIRIATLRMTSVSKSSHVGSCFSVADVLSAVILKCKSDGSVLFFSKGHAAAIYYAALSETGQFNESELESFGRNGSELIGHVNHEVPGVTFSTGSLGHGLPVSVGYAFGNPETRVFVILSDGELNEGTTWESLALASHLKVSNLTIVVDLNGIQSFGTTSEVLNLHPLVAKFKSFNWNVTEIDGHSYKDLYSHFYKNRAKDFDLVLARTIKGKGIKLMENKLSWHYKSWPAEEIEKGIRELRANA